MENLVPNMKKRNKKGQRSLLCQLSLTLKARFVWKLFVLRSIPPRKFYGVGEKYFQRGLKQFAEAIVQK